MKSFLLMTLFSFLILFERIHAQRQPLECDTALFAVMGHEWLLGRKLYSDLWDIKPPGIILTYAAAERIVGNSPRSLFLLNLLPALLSLWGIYRAASWLAGDFHAGLWAALFWTLTNADPRLEASLPMSEVFINSALIWAFAFIVRSFQKPDDRTSSWIVGLFFAFATFYKHYLIGTLGCLLAAYTLVFDRRKAKRTVMFTSAAKCLIPSILLWMGMAIYFFATHRLGLFYNTLVAFSLHYAQQSPEISFGWLHNLAGSVDLRLLSMQFHQGLLKVLGPFFVAMLIGGMIGARKKSKQWGFLGAYFIGTWFDMALPGRYYAHYYQLLLPPLIISTGLAIVEIARLAGLRRGILWGFSGALLAVVLAMELPLYACSAEEWSRRQYGEIYLTVQKFGLEIDRNLPAGSTFYEIGYEPGLYYYSRRRPPTGILMADHWTEGPFKKLFTQRIITDLTREQPELFITTRSWLNPAKKPIPPLLEWCLQRYRIFPVDAYHGPFVLFARRGGRLEARLADRAKSGFTVE